MTALRTGITTGTCAAAAATAAVRALCGEPDVETVDMLLPQGQELSVPIRYVRRENEQVVAAVRKDAGDDPDVTDGVDIVVAVSWGQEVAENLDETIMFVGGEGVGTVTKPGLQVPQGEPAINPVPRKMIAEAVRRITERPVCVEISIPGGREIAEKTFNAKLGIVGGLSILGTTGIVRPYCKRALQDAIRCALDVAEACEIVAPILVAGNIGASAARQHFAPKDQQIIEVANQWGFAVDELAAHRFSSLLLLGHPGKLAKLIRGHWDTHSSQSERATGLVADIAAELGLANDATTQSETVEGVFESLSPDGRQALGDEVARRIAATVAERLDRKMLVAAFLTNMTGKLFGQHGDLSPWQ